MIPENTNFLSVISNLHTLSRICMYLLIHICTYMNTDIFIYIYRQERKRKNPN